MSIFMTSRWKSTTSKNIEAKLSGKERLQYQSSIAKAAGITDVALRNRFREVKKVMHY